MKILKVIVDELPKACKKCRFSIGVIDPGCEITWKYIGDCWKSKRHPDCPLALADGLMDKHESAFSELAKGAE